MKTKHLCKKILTAFLALSLILGIFSMSYAADSDSETLGQKEGSKTATELDDHFESQVTLSLPAANYKPKIDIVFVVDCTSILVAHQDKMMTALQNMADELTAKENIQLNVSVVAFGHEAKALCGLTAVSKENKDVFIANLKEEALANQDWFKGNGGTNIQLGVLTGRQILDNSTTGTAPDERHLVLMTDGGGFWYNNEEKVSACTVYKGDSLMSVGNMDANNDIGGSVRINDSMYLRTKEENPDNPFGTFIEKYGTEIEKSANGSYTKAEIAAAKTDADLKAKITADAYTADEIRDYDKYPFINMERGTYFAAKELLAAKEAGYQITTVGYYYSAGLFLKSLREISTGFRNWTATIGNYYNGSTSASGMNNTFASIADDLIQLVDKGSRVTDVMGSGSFYDFDFVADAAKLRLSVNGTVLPVSVVPDGLSSGETARFVFGEAGSDDVYPFVLHYYKNGSDVEKQEHFVWDINTAIRIDEPVQLTYTVKLVQYEKRPGIYGLYDEDGSEQYDGLYTNGSAILYPVDSKGNEGDSFLFARPTVSYSVTSVTVSKIWKDQNNAAGGRPGSIEVQLYCDGEVYGVPVLLSDENEWRYVWDSLSAKHDWTVKEVTNNDSYTTALSKREDVVSGVTVYSYTLTNTYVSPTVKPSNPVAPPDTGDDSAALWLPVVLLIAALSSAALLKKKST